MPSTLDPRICNIHLDANALDRDGLAHMVQSPAGRSDWGVYQVQGNFEKTQTVACPQMRGCHLINGAGHWVQQEQPERIAEQLVEFLQSLQGECGHG